MNQQRILRLLALMLALVLTVTGAVTVYAAGADVTPTDLTSVPDWPTAPEIETSNAILMDASSGAILYAKNDTEQCHPASITKLMTALLTLENCSLDDTVTFSYRATHELEEGATSIARTEGEQLSVRDCLYALLLASANEVAQALAEHVSGSIEAFADLMNQRAEELGCTGTHFTNPTGLNDDAHVTTCRDMALIARELLKNKDFLEIESHTTYTIPATNKHSESLVIAQKHELVKEGGNHYDGAIAGKTGYTTQTGNTLVTCAQRGDETLICVVMKCSGTQYSDTISLLDYGFNNFNTVNISASESLEITDSSGSLIQFPEGTYIPDDEWLTLPRSMDFAGLDTTVEFFDSAGTSAETSGSDETDTAGSSDTAGAAAAGVAGIGSAGTTENTAGSAGTTENTAGSAGTTENTGGGVRIIGRIHYSHKGAELGTALLALNEEETVSASAEMTVEESSSAEEASSGGNFISRIQDFPPLQFLKNRLTRGAEAGGHFGSACRWILNHPWITALIVLALLILIIRLVIALVRKPGPRHRNAYYLPGEKRRKRRRKKKYHMKY